MHYDRTEFLAALRAGTLTRKHWKAWGARKIAGRVDHLAVRKAIAPLYALGGLQSVCWLAGRKDLANRVYALCDKRPELARYGREFDGRRFVAIS
jgi:hypothetical protein